MNIEIVKDYEGNPKAATFRLDADLIRPFQTIIIPRNDQLTSAAPIAFHGFSLSPSIFRADVFFESGQGTTVSFNAATGNPKFAWADSDLEQIKGSLHQFFATGNSFVEIDTLQKHRSISAFVPEGADQRALVDAFRSVVDVKVKKHGGSYIITDDVTAIPEKQGGFFSKIETGRSMVTVSIAPFGACGGCGLFDLTFGKQTVAAVNERLAQENSPFVLRDIVKDKNMGNRGSVLIRRPTP